MLTITFGGAFGECSFVPFTCGKEPPPANGGLVTVRLRSKLTFKPSSLFTLYPLVPGQRGQEQRQNNVNLGILKLCNSSGV